MRASVFKVAAAAAVALLLASCAMPADDPNYAGASAAGDQIEADVASANAADQLALDAALVAPTSIGIDTPLAAPAAPGAAVISFTDGSEYGAVFETAFAEAATTLGWTAESVTLNMADPTTITTAFDEALAKKPAAIHITGAMVDSITEGLAAAKAANIPVVCTGCSSATAVEGIADASIDGTEQNGLWANVLASYVVDHQIPGEDAGVQYFSLPGGALADFNLEFSTSLLDQCRQCSATESIVDPTMTDLADPAAVASFVSGELSTALGAWALLDSGAMSATVADSLAGDPLLLSPIVVIGRGAAAADITALQGLAGAAPAASASAMPEATPSAGDAEATDGEAAPASRTPEEAAALQAWIGISQPVMAWRVIDQMARLIGGEAPVTGPLPSQLLTGANAGDAVLDADGNYLGVADYQAQFAALWGVK